MSRKETIRTLQARSPSFNISPTVDRAKLLGGLSQIDKDEILRHRLGEEKFRLYKQYVCALLSGQALTIEEVKHDGFDPQRLTWTATKIYLRFLRTENLPDLANHSLPRKLPATNPHTFLGDHSGHKGIGYIQSSQELKDQKLTDLGLLFSFRS